MQGSELLQVKADATLLWIKAQEDAGLDLSGDGEQSHQHFVHGFWEQVDGIEFGLNAELSIHNNRYRSLKDSVVNTIGSPFKFVGCDKLIAGTNGCLTPIRGEIAQKNGGIAQGTVAVGG